MCENEQLKLFMVQRLIISFGKCHSIKPLLKRNEIFFLQATGNFIDYLGPYNQVKGITTTLLGWAYTSYIPFLLWEARAGIFSSTGEGSTSEEETKDAKMKRKMP